MATLKAIHDKVEEIPEEYRSLYTERDGKYELTGIQGIKTQADFDRSAAALNSERDAHKATQAKLKPWGDLDPTVAIPLLDKIPELEVAAAGKIDEEKLTTMAEARAKSMLAPVERENAALKATAVENETELTGFRTEKVTRTIHDSLRTAAGEAKVVDTALDDILMNGERMFQIADDGAVVTRDNVGVTPGVGAAVWLTDMQAKRPHWWPLSSGGGAGGGTGGGNLTNNPWTKNNWNLTAQGKIVQEKGTVVAEQMASAANSKIGATAPTVPAT